MALPTDLADKLYQSMTTQYLTTPTTSIFYNSSSPSSSHWPVYNSSSGTAAGTSATSTAWTITTNYITDATLNSIVDVGLLGEISIEDGREVTINLPNGAKLRVEADGMEKRGLSEVKSIGPFNDFLPTSGSLVKVKEGATVYSTHPSYTREGRKVRRDQVIKVHDVYQGYVDRYHHIDHPEVRNATVHWVGSGGYWKWCDINDVEQV